MTPKPLRFVARLGALLVAAGAVLACGGEWEAYEPDPSNLPADRIQSVSYPSGPYGKSVGSVVEDIKFDYAFYDPMFLCKSSAYEDITLTEGAVPLALSDLYRGSPACGIKKKQLVWLIASAGW